MKKTQFSERQYETAVNNELAIDTSTPFVPTPHAEQYVGFDSASDPTKANAIWRILSVQIPRRVRLLPALWPRLPSQFHGELSGRFCSLFVQYKRPVHQDNARAKYYSKIGGAYYEVQITSHQQRALLQLESRIYRRAVVRYASPAFWSRSDFDMHDEARTILLNSAFIKPAAVKKHRRWIYASPSGKTLLNPEPEEVRPEGWQALIAELSETAVEETLRAHVQALAASIREQGLLFARSTWLERLQRYGEFSEEDQAFLTNLSVVTQAAAEIELDWMVLFFPGEELAKELKSALQKYWPFISWY